AIPVPPDNPDGFAESQLLTIYNRHLLRLLGGRWDGPPLMPSGWATRPPVSLEWERGLEHFRKVYAGDRWVWKDPRTCLTMPFWDEVLGRDHKIVLVFRDPRAVARSLGRRDQLSKAYSLALWERHCRAALASSTGRPTRG